jgi:hypothetical protein
LVVAVAVTPEPDELSELMKSEHWSVVSPATQLQPATVVPDMDL